MTVVLTSFIPAHSLFKLDLDGSARTLKEHMTLSKQEQDLHRTQGGPGKLQELPLIFNSSHYVGKITVGTPPQTFAVLLNSMVAGLWIPSALCPVDRFKMCQDHAQYIRNASSTYVNINQVVGLNGMLANVSLDTVNLAGMAIGNQSFAEVSRYDTQPPTPVPYDGLLGLAPPQTVFENFTSIFSSLVAQQLIDHAVYGMYIVKNSSDAQKSVGGLLIGGRDKSRYNGDLTYTECTGDDMWMFAVKSILLLGSPDMPPLCPEDGCQAILNSASRFVATNHRTMDTLHKYLGAIKFSSDYTYQFNCSTLDQLPTIYMSIQHSLFALPWQSYVEQLKDSKGRTTTCVSNFVGLDDVAGTNWYLGEAFFASLYVEFDIEGKQIGFAQQTYLNGLHV